MSLSLGDVNETFSAPAGIHFDDPALARLDGKEMTIVDDHRERCSVRFEVDGIGMRDLVIFDECRQIVI